MLSIGEKRKRLKTDSWQEGMDLLRQDGNESQLKFNIVVPNWIA